MNRVKVRKVVSTAFVIFILVGICISLIEIDNHMKQLLKQEQERRMQRIHDYLTYVPEAILSSNLTLQKETNTVEVGTLIFDQYRFTDNASVYPFLSWALYKNVTVIHYGSVFYFDFVYVSDTPPAGVYTTMDMEWQPRCVTAYYFLYNDTNFVFPRVAMLVPP